MKLLNCHIENFGKLSDVDIDFKSGINNVIQENGWGKSTLAAFIRIMFYGLEGSRKKEYEENERNRFQPWNRGHFGGEITFEVHGKRYIIIRDFGEKDKDMTFRLLDADTRLESSDYSERIGEELFGINRESFMRTAFIGHQDIRYEGINSSIGARIGSLSQKGDLENYDKVDKRMADYLNDKSSRRKTGDLFVLNNEIKALEHDISTFSDENERIKKINKQRADEVKNEKDIEGRYNLLMTYHSMKNDVRSIERSIENTPKTDESKYKRLSFLFDNRIPENEEVEEKIDICNEIQNLIQKNEMLETLIETEEEKQEEGREETSGDYAKSGKSVKTVISIFFMLLGLALLVTGFVMEQSVLSIVGGASIVAALILLVAGLASGNSKSAPQAAGRTHDSIDRYRQNIKANEESIRRNEDILKGFFSEFGAVYSRLDAESFLYDIKAKAREYKEMQYEKTANDSGLEGLRKEYEEKRSELEAFIKEHPGIDTADESHEKMTTVLSETKSLISRYDRELEDAYEKMDLHKEKMESLEALREQAAELEGKVSIVTATREYMKKAKERFVSDYMKPVKDAYDKYYQIFMNISGDEGYNDKEYMIDANMNIERKVEGSYHTIEAESSGYGDIIGLCIRMALLDVMYDKEKPAIIMDDPFVNMDEKNLAGGRRFLDVVSKDYQIIFMTK